MSRARKLPDEIDEIFWAEVHETIEDMLRDAYKSRSKNWEQRYTLLLMGKSITVTVSRSETS